MRRSGRTAAALAAVALAAVSVAAGCGRNSGTLPTDAFPRGRTDLGATLIAAVLPESVGGQERAVVDLTIYDLSHADGFRIYRQVDGAGFELVSTAIAEHIGTFNQGGELFHFVDRTAPLGRNLEYKARGTVRGEETVASPLTNSASVPPGDVATLYPALFSLIEPIQDAVADTTPVLQWEAVPGADRYLVQVIRSDGELFFAGVTEPGSGTSYEIGSHAGTRVQERPLTLSTYIWFTQALDPLSRVIGVTLPEFFRVDTMMVVLP